MDDDFVFDFNIVNDDFYVFFYIDFDHVVFDLDVYFDVYVYLDFILDVFDHYLGVI